MRHNRQSLRLKNYDYTLSGAYFITICTHSRQKLFGKINNGEMILNEFGRIVQLEWERTPQIRKEIELDAYVIMPDHFHAIVIIKDHPPVELKTLQNEHISPKGLTARSLGSLIAGFKSSVSGKINKLMQTQGYPIWQRNYYEHIIRNEAEHNKIYDYIQNNPIMGESEEMM